MAHNTLSDRYGHDVNQFIFEIQHGDIPYASIVSRLGKSTIDTTTEDLWEVGGDYTELSGDTTLYLWSTSASDTQTIQITGVDANFNQVTNPDGTTYTIDLTGTTVVTVPSQFFSVCQIENEGSTALAGTVYLSRVSGSTLPADLVAIISVGNEVSLLGRCAIPADKTGYLFLGEASANLASVVNTPSAVVSFYAKPFGKVYKLSDEISAGAASQLGRPYIKIPPKTQLKLRAETFDTGTVVRAEFFIILLDNAKWEV